MIYENYSKKSAIMMAKVEELNNIRPRDGMASLALVLEDGKPRDGEVDGGFEFGGLEGNSSK